MPANNTYYNRIDDESNSQYFPTLHDRYQADFDYNGCLHSDDDHADCYRPLAKAVRLG
jgi:hypothetical protein